MIKTEHRIIIGVAGDVTARIIAIACSSYTTYAVTDAYGSEDDAKSYLSKIFLAANILAFMSAFFFGWIS